MFNLIRDFTKSVFMDAQSSCKSRRSNPLKTTKVPMGLEITLAHKGSLKICLSFVVSQVLMLFFCHWVISASIKQMNRPARSELLIFK